MIRNLPGRMGPLLALLLLFLAGSLLSPTFLTSENLLNVLTRSSVIGIIAIGATFIITARGLDLSVGALAAMSPPSARTPRSRATPRSAWTACGWRPMRCRGSASGWPR